MVEITEVDQRDREPLESTVGPPTKSATNGEAGLPRMVAGVSYCSSTPPWEGTE
jgi:hypothetical protein